MSQNFHKFLDLPWELRNQIWNLAVRPDGPGAHVFTIYNWQKDQDALKHMNLELADVYRWEDLQLSAPKGQPSLGESANASASWTRNNQSTYLIDGGLWTSCKESRAVMERRFQQKMSNAFRKDRCRRESKAGWPWHTDKLPATAYFVGDDSIDHYLTVVPSQDLFVLQPHCLENVDWHEISRCIPIGSDIQQFNGLRNIALEFKPAWGYSMEGLTSEEIEMSSIIRYFSRVATSEDVHILWFIDYNMKRKSHAPTKEQSETAGGRVFSQSDRRFVEIGEDYRDSHWDTSTKCYEFVQALRMTIEEDWWRGADDFLFDHYKHMALVGVLACEYF
ncbi:hypothetical protein QQX98_006345 [Neonectria punicea]|uniref:2EXR domain-containing protein n=1 Tax=Neonectria punicea TaxID=979145 RepID=A0ABR1H156_9HYPO